MLLRHRKTKARSLRQGPGSLPGPGPFQRATLCSIRRHSRQQIEWFRRFWCRSASKEEIALPPFFRWSQSVQSDLQMSFSRAESGRKIQSALRSNRRIQLFDDIKAGFLQRFRAGGARAEINQMLDVGK